MAGLCNTWGSKCIKFKTTVYSWSCVKDLRSYRSSRRPAGGPELEAPAAVGRRHPRREGGSGHGTRGLCWEDRFSWELLRASGWWLCQWVLWGRLRPWPLWPLALLSLLQAARNWKPMMRTLVMVLALQSVIPIATKEWGGGPWYDIH